MSAEITSANIDKLLNADILINILVTKVDAIYNDLKKMNIKIDNVLKRVKEYDSDYENEDEEDEDEEDEDEEENDLEDYYDEQEGGAKEKKTTPPKKNKKTLTNKKKPIVPSSILLMETEEEEEDNDENYLQKFDQEINQNYVKNIHPESIIHNYEEVKTLSNIVRDSNNIIIDPFHKTIPFLTKYERARILGQRAKQIESGSKPFIKIPENIIDGYIIAEMELHQKKIPFILRRPLPTGGCEYWNLRDLEIINF